MAEQIHVNGEAHLKVAFGAGALGSLGVSVDGVDIDIVDHTEPVMTDTNGPAVAFDEQQFLSDATIRCQLIFYDEAVLANCRGAPKSDGVMGAAGALWGAQAGYFRLLVTSPTDGNPYNFPKARLKDSASVKLGTRRAVWNLVFYALPYTGAAGTTVGNVLYNRSAS